jgi:hypothetical protein
MYTARFNKLFTRSYDIEDIINFVIIYPDANVFDQTEIITKDELIFICHKLFGYDKYLKLRDSIYKPLTLKRWIEIQIATNTLSRKYSIE